MHTYLNARTPERIPYIAHLVLYRTYTLTHNLIFWGSKDWQGAYVQSFYWFICQSYYNWRCHLNRLQLKYCTIITTITTTQTLTRTSAEITKTMVKATATAIEKKNGKSTQPIHVQPIVAFFLATKTRKKKENSCLAIKVAFCVLRSKKIVRN